MIVDSGARGKPLFGTGIDTGFNIVKFMLAIISLIFDIIFLFQHYVLYNPNKSKKPFANAAILAGNPTFPSTSAQ